MESSIHCGSIVAACEDTCQRAWMQYWILTEAKMPVKGDR